MNSLERGWLPLAEGLEKGRQAEVDLVLSAIEEGPVDAAVETTGAPVRSENEPLCHLAVLDPLKHLGAVVEHVVVNQAVWT